MSLFHVKSSNSRKIMQGQLETGLAGSHSTVNLQVLHTLGSTKRVEATNEKGSHTALKKLKYRPII